MIVVVCFHCGFSNSNVAKSITILLFAFDDGGGGIGDGSDVAVVDEERVGFVYGLISFAS